MSIYGDLYRFLPVLAQRQGFKVAEVKLRHREERGRQGFYGLGVYVRRALDFAWVVRTSELHIFVKGSFSISVRTSIRDRGGRALTC